VASGPVAEVLASRSTGDVRVRVPDPAAAAAVLTAAGFAVTPGDDGLLVHGVTAPGEITRLLAERGHYLEELRPVTADLESAFLAITGDRA
jgi:ABC-2 type transport system ATP-binding protein